MRTRAPVLRITVPALCVALGLAGAAGLSRVITTRKRSAPPATVLAVRPEAVRRVTLDSNGRHVELAHAEAVFGVRDSKNADGPVLVLTARQGLAFLGAVKGL